MSKKLELHFDVDEDEETWLTPQLSERVLGTQSKQVELKEWFGQIQTSERASLLSKKLQKYAQKRAARSDRPLRNVSSTLDVVTEGDGSPERAHSYDCKKPMNNDGISSNYSERLTTKWEVAKSENEINESGIANSVEGSTYSGTLSPDVPYLNSNILATSTPFSDSVSRINLPKLSPSPVQLAMTEKQIISDSDEEFFDASSDFCGHTQSLMLTSSLHEDQLNGNGMLPDSDSGISVVRNCMTQSLMKVEEETPVSHMVEDKGRKPSRSSSVSPRPVSAVVLNSKQKQTNSLALNGNSDSTEQHRNPKATSSTPLSSRGTEIKQQTRLSRPTTSQRPLATVRQSAPAPAGANQHHVVANMRVPNPKAQLLHNLTSAPAEINKDKDPNRNVNSTIDGISNRPSSGNYPSSKTQADIPDMAALREIARQQEEALRQAVEQQQHGNVERKYSWQNEAKSKSPYSSAGSLVSSKSADMSALHRINANVPSKIPGSSRVSRRTGIPTPSRRVGVAVRCASAVPQPTYDDECF